MVNPKPRTGATAGEQQWRPLQADVAAASDSTIPAQKRFNSADPTPPPTPPQPRRALSPRRWLDQLESYAHTSLVLGFFLQRRHRLLGQELENGVELTPWLFVVAAAQPDCRAESSKQVSCSPCSLNDIARSNADLINAQSGIVEFSYK